MRLGQADEIYYDPAEGEAWLSVFAPTAPEEELSDVISRHPPGSWPEPAAEEEVVEERGPTALAPWWIQWGFPSALWGYGILVGGAVVVGMALGSGRRR